MKISKEEIEHIAVLARLSLTEEEKELFGSQLSGILGYMEQLNELDTKDVEPTSHVLALENVMREDIPGRIPPERRSPHERPVTHRKILPRSKDHRIDQKPAGHNGFFYGDSLPYLYLSKTGIS